MVTHTGTARLDRAPSMARTEAILEDGGAVVLE
jgi:hypothetical protein